MAKKGKANASGPVPAAPSSGGDLDAVFSADAVSKLTQRIQSDFSKTSAAQKKGPKPNGSRQENARGGKPGGAGKPGKAAEPPVKREGNQRASDSRKQDSRQQSSGSKQENVPRGLKRARDTDAPKSAEAQSTQQSRNPKSKQKNKQSTANVNNANAQTQEPHPEKGRARGKISKDVLLKEIIELGGTKEDLDLVEGIDSDSDAEEEAFGPSENAGKQVKTDLRNFMKEIGLEAGKYADATTASDEESDEENEQDSNEWVDQGENEDEGDVEEQEDGEEEDVEEEDVPLESPGEKKKGNKLIFQPRPDWHAEALPALTPPEHPLSGPALQKLQDKAAVLLKNENDLYSRTQLIKSSDRQFLSTIMQSGTLSDKISALTLICQESPLHTMKSLETLLGLARKKSRNQAIAALQAIKDLFASGSILPSNRLLKYFKNQPALGSKGTKDIHLIVWAYENWLKGIYFQLLQVLEDLCRDPLEYVRNSSVGFIHQLLKEKPEQEANLLRLLVNKLGDSEKKVASKVSYLLLQLQTAHPNMRNTIINSIESEVVFRPGNSAHAKYYAIITLNQTVLSSLSHDTANKLLNIYFSLFAALLKSDSSNRAANGGERHIKFSEMSMEQKKKMNKKAKARAQKDEKRTQFEEETDSKLISAILTGVNRAFPFSKIDDDVFEKHMDTLFRITHSGNFNTSIQALMLIYQVSSKKQAVTDRFYRTLYESLLDQRLVNSSKQTMYINLLFQALRADTSVKRVQAFVKRIIQSATFHQPAFICGILYLLSELVVSMPQLHNMISQPEDNEDDEEEVFRDVPEEGDEPLPEVVKSQPKIVSYNSHKRDPQHAQADRSSLWELTPFLNHFHPTVAIYATSLMNNKPMPSKPDLGMHTLSHFLERFIYRNPKHKPPPARGSSIMQPLAGGGTTGMVLASRNKKAIIPVNSEAFWRRAAEDVGADEVFFHRYFNNRAATAAGSPNQKKKEAKDDEDDGSDAGEGEGEVWKALVQSRPEIEGDDGDVDFDDDGDVDMANLSGDDENTLDDSDGGIDLDLEDDDAEWDTEEDEGGGAGPGSGEEDGDVDMETAFEKELAKASAKRAEVLDKDEEDAQGADKKKRRKLKHLPTFASADDYAEMLASDSE